MKTFFEKLEHAAEQWVNIVDEQFQQTTVQVVTGKVFTHDASAHNITQEEIKQSDAPLTTAPVRPTRESRPSSSSVCPPTLQRASATPKR